MNGNSLDPRVNRLPKIGVPGELQTKAPLDQFGTFEVFVQPKDGKPFQHEGAVHAPNIEMAYVLAKETYTRRFVCSSLYVVETRNIYVSAMTSDTTNAYDTIVDVPPQSGNPDRYEVFHLLKRGKQHIQAGVVLASGPSEAMAIAKKQLRGDKLIYNVWVVRSSDIRFTTDEEKDFWITLPEKKFRDASDYKGGDKLKEFLERAK